MTCCLKAKVCSESLEECDGVEGELEEEAELTPGLPDISVKRGCHIHKTKLSGCFPFLGSLCICVCVAAVSVVWCEQSS